MIWAQPKAAAIAQGGDVILRPDPLSLGLTPDAQGTVTILLEKVQDLYGMEFHLAFDPNVVEVMDADPAKEGVQIEPADWWKDGFVAVNNADNRSGRIAFAATLLNPARPVSGDRAVAVITFRAMKAGVSALSIESAILSTREAEEISYTAQNGGIGVNPSGQAPDVSAIAEPTESYTSTVKPGRVVLAGVAILAFLIALGVFIYILRYRVGAAHRR
ncbi:MAG: cohesin domain-containing protein [Chloroflexi bacterium]|nr:cohesin domain-containing protein [Chloroflexota bacterium]